MKLQEELDVQQAMEEKPSEMILADVKKDIAHLMLKCPTDRKIIAIFYILGYTMYIQIIGRISNASTSKRMGK